MRQRESDVLAGVRKLLDAYGVLHVRMNAGLVRTRSGSCVRLASAGWPDIVGCLPLGFGAYSGRFLGIEVKAKGERPRREQVSILRELQASGAIVFWVDDVVHAQVILDRLRAGARPWLGDDGSLGEGEGS